MIPKLLPLRPERQPLALLPRGRSSSKQQPAPGTSCARRSGAITLLYFLLSILYSLLYSLPPVLPLYSVVAANYYL